MTAIGLALGTLLASVAHGAGTVSQVLLDEAPATPFRYSVDGHAYTWGLGTNQAMRGFVAGGVGYGYTDTVTRVELRRDDIADVAEGNPCGVFVQRLDEIGDSLAADYPSDGSGTGECDVPELLASRIVNRGALDLFSNVLPDAKNIERADFVFDHGVLAPFVAGGRELAGHLVGEKRGNNPVRIAAILELDVFGQPAAYGPLIQIDSKHDCVAVRPCYAETDLVHEYAFFQNEMLVPQGFPARTGLSHETVAMAFVDLGLLGLHAGQRYFGFSLFADDVDRNVHVLTDPSTFPDDTSDDYISVGDDADIYGGLAGYFVADDLNAGSGRVYLDEDDDGAFGEGDAGIPDIGITLYADTNGDGAFDPLADEALSDSIDSDPRGVFQLPGLDDGGYFVVLHEGDPDLPGGLSIVPGHNPHALFVSGADVGGIDFPFSNGRGGAGGGDGGLDAGAGSGGADAGTGDGGPESGDPDPSDGADDGAGTGGTGPDDGDQGDAGTGTGTGTGTGEGEGEPIIDTGQADAGTGDGGAGTTDAQGSDSGDGDGRTDGPSDGGRGDGGTMEPGDAGDTGGEAGNEPGGGGAGDAGAGDAGSGDGMGADAGAGTSTGTGGGTTGTGGDGGNDPGALSMDDSSTNAVADSAVTDQGVPVPIEVLANDTDAAGAGLTITAVSRSPDATVTIGFGPAGVGRIDYAPDFGFFGTDTFMYTVVDGTGTEATGTVTVAVNRFSDIDGDGINDFTQCDCDDLTLETGVKGSGIGRTSAGALAGLAGALLLVGSRRRRRRSARVASAATAAADADAGART